MMELTFRQSFAKRRNMKKTAKLLHRRLIRFNKKERKSKTHLYFRILFQHFMSETLKRTYQLSYS